MPVTIFVITLIALFLFAGIGYIAVLTFRHVRLKASVVKLFDFEVEADRGEPKPPRSER